MNLESCRDGFIYYGHDRDWNYLKPNSIHYTSKSETAYIITMFSSATFSRIDYARHYGLSAALAVRHFNMGNWSDPTSSLYHLRDVYVAMVLGEDNAEDETVSMEAFEETMKRAPSKSLGIIGDRAAEACRSQVPMAENWGHVYISTGCSQNEFGDT